MMLFIRVEDLVVSETLYQLFRSYRPSCLAVLVAISSIIFQTLPLKEEGIKLFFLRLLFLHRKLSDRLVCRSGSK